MYVEAYNFKKIMKDLLKDIKETSTAEKFWTSILLLLWIVILCYSFIAFVVLQVLFFIFIYFFAIEFEEKDYVPILWIFTSVFVILTLLFTILIDKVQSSIKTNPLKKFNNWLNKL